MAPSLTQEQADLLIETAENQVLSENKRFYQRLLNELSTLNSTMQTHYGQQLESIAEVANLQLAKLATYPFA